MARNSPPLYGRFDFNDIHLLIERLRKIARNMAGDSEFNTYLTTFGRQSYYGLDYDEWLSVYEDHKHEIRSMSSSYSGQAGKSVSITVRYPRKGSSPETQFVIVAGSPFQNREIKNILLGEWEPQTEEVRLQHQRLSEVVALVKSHLERQEEKAAEEKEKARLRKEKETEKRKNERQKRRKPPPPVRERLRLSSLRDAFQFDENIPSYLVLDMLEQISAQFLQHAPFNIRVVTTDGQPFSNIGLKGLHLFLDKRRRTVRKIYMDAATQDGELVDMILVFGPGSSRYNAELEITSTRSKQIQSKIREVLEKQVDLSIPGASMVHEMFRFDQHLFVLDRVIKLIQAISTKYLNRENVTGFLSTLQGETYPALTLRQLRTVYQQHKGNVSFLLFGINQPLTGQTFSLMFQFQSPGHKPYGSLSMMWGNHETHQLIRALIWEQLELRSYRPNKPVPLRTPGPASQNTGKTISVEPVFKSRDFTPVPLTALVVMPLEAYWSETLWVHLQQTLKRIGIDCKKSDALYSEDVLEDTWTQLNEVEWVVADLTYKHPDVFYKIGVAHTLGKKVVLITQHARDLPTDFKKFPFVVYDNNIHGLHQLAERLLELMKS